jgi:hypothetical protein
LLVVLVSMAIRPSVADTAAATAMAANAAAAESAPPEIKRTAEILRSRLAQRRRQAEKLGLNDAARVLLKLEAATKQLGVESRRDTALVYLNDMTRQLNGARRQLGQSQPAKVGRPDAGERQTPEGRMLDEAMQQINEARQRMNCPNCRGAGCRECQPSDAVVAIERRSQTTDGDRPGHQPDPRHATRSGAKQTIDARFYDSQVKPQVGQGTGTVTSLVEGANDRGHVEASIQKQLKSVRQGSTDPIEAQQLPSTQAEHVREYFDRLRQGE